MQDQQRKNYLSSAQETLEKREQQEIQRLKLELENSEKVLNALKKMPTENMTKLRFAQQQNRIYTEKSRKSEILLKLKEVGVMVKNRGRPKKDPSYTYKNTHVKFTAMLKPENLSYLKEQKKVGRIQNISKFLDYLIEEHKRSVPNNISASCEDKEG